MFSSMIEAHEYGPVRRNTETDPPMSFRLAVQHVLNPLHVYCRLRELGFSNQTAHRFCGAYERVYRCIGFRVNDKAPRTES
jgi:hypothetical protein